MKMNANGEKKSFLMELPDVFVSQRRIAKLKSNGVVQVDASAICAYLHCKPRSAGKKASMRRLKDEFFSSNPTVRSIKFGSLVEISVADMRDIFGGIEQVPAGAVRFISSTTRTTIVKKTGQQLDAIVPKKRRDGASKEV